MTPAWKAGRVDLQVPSFSYGILDYPAPMDKTSQDDRRTRPIAYPVTSFPRSDG